LRLVLLGLLISGMIAWHLDVTGATPTTDAVTVNPAVVTQTLSPTFFGINDSGFWDSAQASDGSALALAQTPIKLVRFAGGTPADWYDWAEPYYNGTTAGGASWSTQSPLDVWHYAQKLGATPLFQTNYQGNVPNPPLTPQTSCAVHPGNPADCEIDSLFNGAGPRQSYAANSAQNAAAWVTYDKNNHIPALMEVGNEEDSPMTSSDDSRFQPYIDAFNAQAAAMHQADPGVKVIGPAATNEWYWWYNPSNVNGSNSPDSLNMFLKGTGNKYGTGQVDGVSVHYYTGGTTWVTAENSAQNWLSPTGDWHTIQQSIQANDTRTLPVYVSEWNVGASDSGTGFNQTQGHALVVADVLGAFAQSGVAGEAYFVTHGAGQYGLLYGTGESRPVDSATPTYYATALWKYMGNQLLQEAQSDDASTIMSTYASKSADGSLHFMAINKTNSAHQVQFALSGLSLTGQHLQVASVIPQHGGVFDQDAYYNGGLDPSAQQPLPGPVDGGTITGDALTYSVPAYSAVVLSVGGGAAAPTFTPTSTPNPSYSATPTNTPQVLSVTATGTLSAVTVAPGGSQQLTSVATSNLDLGPVNILVEVYDPKFNRVYANSQSATLLANTPVTIHDTYTVATNALEGTYYYHVGVFNTTWTQTYTYNSNAGTFTVSSSPPTPTNTPTPLPSTSTSLASSANPSVFGQTVVFTATVSGAASIPIGSVTFKDGGTTLGTAALNAGGVATFSTGGLAVGTHSLTAAYSGGTTSNPLSQAVTKAASLTTLSSSANPALVGQTVTFTATVAVVAPGVGTPTGSVTFNDGNTVLAAVPLSGTGSATYQISGLSAGAHSVSASYQGDTNIAPSQADIDQRIELPSAPLVVTAGWSLASLSLTPTTPLSASTVLQGILHTSGGHLAAIYGLSTNRWSPSLILHGTGAPSGVDFTLQPGRGYLVYSDQSGSYLQAGTIPPTQPVWTLTSGWNLVGTTLGATSPLSASTVLLGALQSSGGQLAAIYALHINQWSSPLVLKRGGVSTGTDFVLQAGQGYLLYTDTGASYTPGAAPARRSRLQAPGSGAAPIPGSPQQPPLPGLPSP
jgi:hypothetical protein